MNFKKYESKKRLFEIPCQMYSDKDGNAIVNGIKRFEWNTIFIKIIIITKVFSLYIGLLEHQQRKTKHY